MTHEEQTGWVVALLRGGRSVIVVRAIARSRMDGLALHKRLVSLGAAPATIMITGHGDMPMAVAL
jgi:FixJ family two-component response regulator